MAQLLRKYRVGFAGGGDFSHTCTFSPAAVWEGSGRGEGGIVKRGQARVARGCRGRKRTSVPDNKFGE
eukprot:7045859-Pyramimonas_sp.AAC.1